MDDFGSGYSSFNTFKDAHVDVLKADMKFMDGIDYQYLIVCIVIHDHLLFHYFQQTGKAND